MCSDSESEYRARRKYNNLLPTSGWMFPNSGITAKVVKNTNTPVTVSGPVQIRYK